MERRLAAYETVVFDIGGVLLSFDPPELVKHFFPEEVRQPLYDTMFGGDWPWGRFDLGADPNERIAEELARQAGVEGGDRLILDMLYGFCRYMEPLPLSRSIPELKQAGKRVYLLTNYAQPSLSLSMERFPFLKMADGYVCSAEEKLTKPDPEIFRVLCRRYEIDPAKAIFIDDNAPNTAAAEKLGFHVWNYHAGEAE